jgi:ABC-type proline/glycine betaine transport system permease subunit
LLSIVTALIGMLLGFGGLQELVVRGILYREPQPFLVGAIGALVGASLLLTALAHWRRWARWPRLAIAAGSASVLFHLYASMPPERNVGLLAMLLGVGIGIALIVRAARAERAPLELIKR